MLLIEQLGCCCHAIFCCIPFMYSASEMTYIVSSGALNSTRSLTLLMYSNHMKQMWLPVIRSYTSVANYLSYSYLLNVWAEVKAKLKFVATYGRFIADIKWVIFLTRSQMCKPRRDCWGPGFNFMSIMLSVSVSLKNLRLQNDLYCVGWGVKLYSLTVSLKLGAASV